MLDNNKMISELAQQNKQQNVHRKTMYNKFLSIKSMARKKKMVIKKSVPVSSFHRQNFLTLCNDSNHPQENINQSYRQRAGSAKSNSDNSARNVINIKFQQKTHKTERQKQTKIRKRMFSNFSSNEQKKTSHNADRSIPQKAFEETLTIEPIMKVDREISIDKKKYISNNLNSYMLLTKKSFRKSESMTKNTTFADFQQIGRAIECFERHTNSSFSKKQFKRHQHLPKHELGTISPNKILYRKVTPQKQANEIVFGQDDQVNIESNREDGYINVDQKEFKDLIPVRKPTNRKDHFVFAMTDKPANGPENKIELYRDFLWKMNYSNGMYVVTPENNEFGYKAYFGFGNNSCMLKSILRRRYWWHIVPTNTDKNSLKDCQFVWSQLKINSLFKNQIQQSQPELLEKDEKALELKRLYLENPEQELESQNYSLYHHARIFNQIDFKNWVSHSKKNQKHQLKISQQTYIKRCWLYRKKEIKKIDDSFKLRIHNHLEYNYYIGNKKALFYNIKRLCQLKGQDPFQVVPMTFHIIKGIDDPNYEQFLEYYKKMQEIKKNNKDFKNIWICKPGQNTNQGNGISVCFSFDDIKHRLRGREKNGDGKPRTFILQKYIEKPFLFKNRKFDIRHYLLLTCFNGNMKAYWYDEGYIRTSCSPFSLKNSKDVYIHLTNDAIQKRCDSYGKHEKGNKISYEDFQKYLNSFHKKKKYDFLGRSIKQMKQLALKAVEATYSMLDPKRKQHNFQLIGLDFMIDQEFNPWLIEANTNPCLQLSCPLLQKLIPNMIEQLFRICVDPFFPPPENWTNTKKQFFSDNTLNSNNFELIFDEKLDSQAINDLLHQASSNKYENILNKIQEDNQVFDDDGNENWEQTTN